MPPFPSLARQWGGWIPNGMHVVLGGTGVGKTAFALQTAGSCGCPCLYVTCEMSPAELLRRTAARVTSTYLGKFKDGSLTGPEVRRLAARAAAECPQLVLADATTAYAHPRWIREAAEAVRGKFTHLLIVIDSLHAWAESSGADAGEYDLISVACRELRTLASQMECPMIVVAERNRASFGKGAGKDKTSSGAGSRKIEYGAESVMSIERDDEMPAPTGELPITLTFGKDRNGGAGREIRLLFAGGFQKYTEA